MSSDRIAKALQRAHASMQMGDAAEAVAVLHKTVQKFPKDYDCWLLLGQAKGTLGDHAGADPCFRKAIAIDARNLNGWNGLGQTFLARNLHAQAATCFKRALECEKNPHPDIFQNYCAALIRLDQFGKAAQVLETVTAQTPTRDLLRMLAVSYQGLDRFADAARVYRQMLAGGARDHTVDLNLSCVYIQLNDFEQATEHARRAVSVNPSDGASIYNLGLALLNSGKIEESIEVLQASGEASARSALLLAHSYMDPPDPVALRRAHEEQGEFFAGGAPRTMGLDLTSPDERLRLGFFSPDLREHPVGFFFEGLFSKLNRERFELFVYSDTQKPDAMTARFQVGAEHWRDVCGKSDNDLVSMVAEDRIHIFFDLAGHLANERLAPIARRIAPVQVSYLGYSATTGLAAMDYFFSDAVITPDAEAESHYTETVIRLGDVVATYTPPSDSDPISAPPLASNGYPTFGSFAKLSKISATTVRLWADTLQAAPTSRMLLMAKGLSSPVVQQRISDQFAARGIDPSRLTFRDAGSLSEYMKAHHDVDLILDTVPWNGHTTTMHGLWMGVPTLSVVGAHHAGRFGESVLRAAGLTRYLSPNMDGFAQLAAAIVGDAESLARDRSTMRERLSGSPLMDHDGIARRFEEACMDIVRIHASREEMGAPELELEAA